ncbi:MAG: response regulator [Bacteroidetes bacterium]|nr:response regulator [Bacteroidota bacterium]
MKHLHLLLVEDNVGDVVLAEEAIVSIESRISFIVVEGGKEALLFLRNSSSLPGKALPQAILVDINLPGMNGKELLRIIKSDPELDGIPVIVFSTNSSVKEIREVYNLGADWYATKPDKNDDYRKLILRIEQLLIEQTKCDSFEKFTIS